MSLLLEEAILGALRPGATERFELPELDLPRLAFSFARAARRETAGAEFFRALQLAIALEETLESPTAAARLRALAARSPEIIDRLIEQLSPAKAMDETRRFLRSEGREVVLRAPPVPRPWKQRLREEMEP